MANPLRHHADSMFTYPRDAHWATAGADVHAAWLALGRAIFGGYFVFSGINHFMQVAMLAGYTASKGVPSPQLAVMGSGALILVGGMSLILGAWPRIGALLILLFLLGVTPVMHDFWNATDPQARMNDFGNFLKNVGLMGGACFAMALPAPWPGSVHRAVRAKAVV
jgi:putative oxidoreductase